MDEDFLIQDLKQAEVQRKSAKLLDRRPEKPLWREYLETGLLALLAAVLLRLFVVSAYRVSSASMENAMYEGDYLFVNKLAYSFGQPPQAPLSVEYIM